MLIIITILSLLIIGSYYSSSSVSSSSSSSSSFSASSSCFADFVFVVCCMFQAVDFDGDVLLALRIVTLPSCPSSTSDLPVPGRSDAQDA